MHVRMLAAQIPHAQVQVQQTLSEHKAAIGHMQHLPQQHLPQQETWTSTGVYAGVHELKHTRVLACLVKAKGAVSNGAIELCNGLQPTIDVDDSQTCSLVTVAANLPECSWRFTPKVGLLCAARRNGHIVTVTL